MTEPIIHVSDLSVGYGRRVLLRRASFDVARGDIFAIMGPSGCGKSSLLRVLTGMMPAFSGRIFIDGRNFTNISERGDVMRNVGVSFQSGALFSSMTVAENVALPLMNVSDLSESEKSAIVSEKLKLVGLENAADLYPSEISGGMCKRAGIARAIVHNPKLLFLDEPSAGLDPISSRQLDDLILDINRQFGTTIVIVSHELESIFAICKHALFMDNTQQKIFTGRLSDLLKNPPTDMIKLFLTRGRK